MDDSWRATGIGLAILMTAGLMTGGLMSGCSRDAVPVQPPAASSPVVAASAVPPAPAVAPPGADSRRSQLDAWLAAWNRHDPQQVGGLLADDVEYFDAGFAGIQHGRQAAVDHGVSVFMRGVPDLHWELRGEPVVGVDSIAYEWTFTGTNTGTWGGIPATRQSIQLKGVSLLRFRGDKIAYVGSYYDTGTLNRQLGL